MDILSLVLLACALAMDSFAVSLCKGLSVKRLKIRHYFIVGLYFGGFQALMVLLGYFLGVGLSSFIDRYDHWIAFILLAFIGLKMMKESFSPAKCDTSEQFSPAIMLPLAVATSIDALAVGVSFAFLKTNIYLSACIIGLITFALCAIGIKIGKQVGVKFSSKAEFIGGVVLVLIGCKILAGHFLGWE